MQIENLAWKRVLGRLAITPITALFVVNTALAADTHLDQIKAEGVLSACYASYRPFALKNPVTGKWEGLNVDIGELIAKDLGVKLRTVDSQWSTIVQNLKTSKCDIIMSALYVTPARAEVVLYTIPYAQDDTGVYVRRDSKAESIADLDKEGNIVLVFAGAAESDVATRIFHDATVKQITESSPSATLLSVASNRADVALKSKIGARDFLQKNPQLNIKEIETKPLNPTPFAFAVRKDDHSLEQYVNETLTSLEQSGKLDKLKSKWGLVNR